MRRSKLLVQIIGTRENIQRLIPALDETVSEGLIAMSDGGDQYGHQEGRHRHESVLAFGELQVELGAFAVDGQRCRC